MIRRDWEGDWLLISQPEHARLSGLLAEHWGSEDFFRPEPWQEVRVATFEHDNGWRDWEKRPALNADGAPAHFTETPLDVNFDIFRRGVKRLHDQGNPYAAALVSRHAANVYASVRRVRPVKPQEEAEIDGYIAEQEGWQGEIGRELIARPGYERAATKEGIYRNGRFVTTLDAFSLVLCCGWALLDRFQEVPVGEDGFTPLGIELVDGVVLRVRPWPFDCAALEFPARGRRLPSSPFRTTSDFHTALEQTPPTEIVFRVTPG
ncbi:MAG: DUF3891 family protein [Nitrospinota bacterium]